ncbi:MAG: SMP-30/gluconolactonase/LRE family protein [Verrucomicrobia bacterium]|nr:SMP-30/gluconolactonase/LRE family protein [Verrucomicrobiota bacterium]
MKNISAECVFEAKAVLGEGPSWDAAGQRVLWVDIESSLVCLFDPAKTENKSFSTGCHVGSAVLSKRGDVIAATQKGFARLDLNTGQLTPICDPESDLPNNRFNDGKCDPAGRFWAGTMGYDESKTTGSLYVLDEHLNSKKILDGVAISNGLAWTENRRTMYFIDTPTMCVDAFDFDPTNSSISNRRTAIRIPEGIGYPDGMTIDREGMLWICLWDGWAVTRWNPNTGEQLGKINLPVARATACCFGGKNLDELYITSASTRLCESELDKQPLAGSLFRALTGVSGFPPFLFDG